jgi:hypothetical protein
MSTGPLWLACPKWFIDVAYRLHRSMKWLMSKTEVADFSNSVPKVLGEVSASIIRVEGSSKCKNWNIMCKSGGIWTKPHPVWTDGHLKGCFTGRTTRRRSIRGSNLGKSKVLCPVLIFNSYFLSTFLLPLFSVLYSLAACKSVIHSFIHLVVCLTTGPSLFQIELSTSCDLKLPPSNESILKVIQ